MKRQLAEWEKIFTNNATKKVYFPNYTNSLYNSVTTTKKQPNWKMGRRLNRRFSKFCFGLYEKTLFQSEY